MLTNTIRRQYDEIIASNYDLDPQGITGDSQDFAIGQLKQENVLAAGLPTLNVLDIGMGTGMFLSKLRKASERIIEPFGLDLSENMAQQAKLKHPDLEFVVDDATRFDAHFSGREFDLICTHFITGFVPIPHLAPRIFDRLSPDGYWSFLGATSTAYPELQKMANSRLVHGLFGAGEMDVSKDVPTPENTADACGQLKDQGFVIASAETYRPELNFPDFQSFMEYGYHGGWLTPFIEKLRLQDAGWATQKLVNFLIFPIRDHHHIAAIVARKPPENLI